VIVGGVPAWVLVAAALPAFWVTVAWLWAPRPLRQLWP
jgi:hypothetical protein